MFDGNAFLDYLKEKKKENLFNPRKSTSIWLNSDVLQEFHSSCYKLGLSCHHQGANQVTEALMSIINELAAQQQGPIQVNLFYTEQVQQKVILNNTVKTYLKFEASRAVEEIIRLLQHVEENKKKPSRHQTAFWDEKLAEVLPKHWRTAKLTNDPELNQLLEVASKVVLKP